MNEIIHFETVSGAQWELTANGEDTWSAQRIGGSALVHPSYSSLRIMTLEVGLPARLKSPHPGQGDITTTEVLRIAVSQKV